MGLRRGSRTTQLIGIVLLGALLLLGAALAVPELRGRVRSIVQPEPPPRITPLAVAAPAPSRPAQPTAMPTSTPAHSIPPAAQPESSAAAAALPTPTAAPTPTPGPVERNGQIYDAYIPAALKDSQFFQYSCEFDAAWVILETYGIATSADELVSAIPHDTAVEPYIEETADGFLIHGGDIETAFAGDYTKNFLARSTGKAFRGVFERYGLAAELVTDRAGVERALRSGQLVWMKTTVDFNRWRPATWTMPDGRTHQTVLGNDHAVVAIGYSARGVVIRDVLGPTSTNRQRPYEYEVDWDTFMAAWAAQSFDGVAVAPPTS